MAGYCVTDDIQREIQNTVFSTDSRPTLIQVGQFCTEISNLIDTIILSTSIRLPVKNKKAISYLKTVAVYGVAARVYGIMAIGSEAAKRFQDSFEKELKRIENNPQMLNVADDDSPRLDVVLNTFPDNTDPQTPRAFRRFETQW